MLLHSLESLLRKAVKKYSTNHCDDQVDRLNHSYTFALILVFATVVSYEHYVGHKICCWIPAEYHKHGEPHSEQPFEDYIHNYCWIKNTYLIPMMDPIPVDIQRREDEEISYYQWVPLILLIEALLFKLPHILWKLLHPSCGIDIRLLSQISDSSHLLSPKERDTTIMTVVNEIDHWIEMNSHKIYSVLGRRKAEFSRVYCFFCNKSKGTFLTFLYLIIKALIVANVIGQVFLLNAFITTDSDMFGIEWLKSTGSSSLTESRRFPRVTLCDFMIRQLQNVQRFTVQCVLPINLFNEKVFLTLWFWFLILAFFTVFNFFRWLWLVFLKSNNVEFTKKYLKISKLANRRNGRKISWTEDDKRQCRKFAEEYLRQDGCFVLRIIGMNTSDAVASQIVEGLYRKWQTHEDLVKTSRHNEETDPKYGPTDE